jgi:hypothetical protein
MTNFVKGHWYQNKNTKQYFQCMTDAAHGDNYFRLRLAGSESCFVKVHMDITVYAHASLTPDFSNAKVGDGCFDVELEHCEISEVREYDVYTRLMVDDGKGNLNPHIIYKDGYAHNPLLFNSFAQFTAYWAEKALDMEGNHD